MMLPRPPHFDPSAYEDAPSWLGRFFGALNRALGDIYDAINARGKDFSTKRDLLITTDTFGGATVDVKTDAPPGHLLVSGLRTSNGSSVIAYAWQPMPNGARLVLFNLIPSTRYFVTILYK